MTDENNKYYERFEILAVHEITAARTADKSYGTHEIHGTHDTHETYATYKG